MSESDIDPEDDLLIRGRPRSTEEDEWDEWDDPDDGQPPEDDISGTPAERDGLPDGSRAQILGALRVTG